MATITETAVLTTELLATFQQHIALVRGQLDALSAQEDEARGRASKALQALQVETDASKRIALRAEAQYALEADAGIEIARARVKNNFSQLSRDAAQSVTGWCDTTAYPLLEANVAVWQVALDLAQARFDGAMAQLNSARWIQAQAKTLLRAVDENFQGVGATNGPEWAPSVDNAEPKESK